MIKGVDHPKEPTRKVDDKNTASDRIRDDLTRLDQHASIFQGDKVECSKVVRVKTTPDIQYALEKWRKNDSALDIMDGKPVLNVWEDIGDTPTQRLELPNNGFYLELARDVKKDSISVDIDSYADGRLFLKMRGSSELFRGHKALWVLPDGLELSYDSPSILENCLSDKWTTTGRRDLLEGKVIEDQVGDQKFASKGGATYSDHNMFDEVQMYQRLHRLIAELSLQDQVRIPKLFFATEEGICLESLFDYQNIANSRDAEVIKRFHELPLHRRYDLTEWECFVTGEKKNPVFVIVDAHKYRFHD
ncbi:MAG: hypothetical protein V1921_05760 [Candidatus Altiarchaeota archaeon]